MRRAPSRRHFMQASLAAAATLPVSCGRSATPASEDGAVFRHGVASGDPQNDGVLLWTRVTPRRSGTDGADVRWTVATDPGLSRIVARGDTRTGAARDFTVKVEVTGLQPGRAYYYRFESDGSRSPVGRTRTLPTGGVSRLRLGVVSCSNYPFGYFTAYAALAARHDLDAVLHLGDYLYEYGNGEYGDGTALGRITDPRAEMRSLADYRARHAQYKTDPDLQAVHRQHPFLVVWDDHEFANDAWTDGAENHQPGEGPWATRRSAAVQAYLEWMPIREEATRPVSRIYRTLRFGSLADLVLLDTRAVGRDVQAPGVDAVAEIERADRTLLGAAQEQWLGDTLTASARDGIRWQLFGQQVMFAPQARPGAPALNVDAWDGYRAARERVFEALETRQLRNVAVLTGDEHCQWVYDVPRRPFDDYDPGTGRGSVAVELIGTSVTSPSAFRTDPAQDTLKARLRQRHPHLHEVEWRHRGYFVVDVTPERLQADFFAMRTIEDRRADETFLGGFAAPAGQMHLTPQASPAAPASGPDPAP